MDGETVNMSPEEHKMLRVGSLWFPLAMVVSMLLIVGASSWTVSARNERVDAKFDKLTESVSNLSKTVEMILVRKPDGDYISRNEWVVMCLQQEIMNPTTFKCPYSRSGWKTSTVDTIGVLR
jgi:hypothetical protein